MAAARGIATFGGMIRDRVRPGFVREWRPIQKQWSNFFKHADHNPDATLEDFRPESTTCILFGATQDYAGLFGCRIWAMSVLDMIPDAEPVDRIR
ncbi:hypothetical protein [Sphingomonas gellani]|uniref:hypothetical protein n=1 Tax=Sphingomonas gellani TaxID=1166340 RepID=UPI00148085AB|nr:hypothetical protein [Sphingomonas gellani]